MRKRFGLAIFTLLLATCAWPQTQHGINWSWAAVTTDTQGNTITVDGYNIYCATSATGPFATKTNSALITSTSYLETGLTVGTTYYCQIAAVKGMQEGAHSATGSGLFQFPPAAPAAPSAVVQ